MAKDHSNHSNVSDTVSIERQILNALCRDASGAETNRLVRKLSEYSWREPEHATVFQAIKKLTARGKSSWREELPSQTTRMGFPDVDWRSYFDEAGASRMSPAKLVTRLLNLGEQAPRR